MKMRHIFILIENKKYAIKNILSFVYNFLKSRYLDINFILSSHTGSSLNILESKILFKKICGKIIIFAVPVYITTYTLLAIWLLIDGWVNSFSSIYWLWSITGKDAHFPLIVTNLLFTIIGSLFGCSILGITSFHQHNAIDKNFDLDHFEGFFFAPLLALIVGILIYAILQSGLVVLTNNITSSSTATLGYLAIGGISGYNWDVFVKKLQELSKNVLNIKDDKKEEILDKDNISNK